MSKGDKQRPMDISRKTFEENFDRIFKDNKKEKKNENTKRKRER
jgi:hypothetical protein